MKKTYQVLHLSHTHIAVDARILKEMHALQASSLPIDLHGLGVVRDEGSASSALANDLQLDSIRLWSRGLNWLPRFVRHFLTLPEYVLKMGFGALRYRPQIVHCHDILALPIGVLLKLINGTKVIYDAHELESNMNGQSRLTGWLVYGVEWILWRYVDHFITVSPSIAKWYQNQFSEKPTTLVLNSPLLEERESSSAFGPDYLRNRFKIPANQKIFIYVGAFGEGRGIEQLINLFKEIRDAHLVFLGHGRMQEHIVKASQDHRNIHFHPSVPHEQVVSAVRSADVGFCMIGKVSLSDYYCLPNKLFEYSFAGVSVIASDFPDIRQLVDQYQLGVCCEQDSASIKAAVESIVRGNVQTRVDTSKLRDLSWQAQTTRLLDLYNALIDRITTKPDTSELSLRSGVG